METRSKKVRIGSLPEDRRGTSVAGAGRDRMLASDSQLGGWAGVRDAGGSGLSQRTTAGSSEGSSSRNSSRSVTPAEDVSQEAPATQPATTKAGKPRVRMKWSDDMNLFIMRTYYYITKLETDRTMHCKRLHDRFVQQYPDLDVSAQRIGDQRRAILRNKLLSDSVLQDLKKQVAKLLATEESDNSINPSIPTPTLQQSQVMPSDTDLLTCTPPFTFQRPLPLSTIELSHATTQTNMPRLSTITQLQQETGPDDTTSDIATNKLLDQLDAALTRYTGTDPTNRPRLPRLKENKQLYDFVAIFNKHILQKYFSIDSDIHKIHTLIYCSALVISQNLGYKIRDTSTNPGTKRLTKQKPGWQIRIEGDIKKLRVDIGRLSQFIRGIRSVKVVSKVQEIFSKNQVHSSHENNNRTPEEHLDTLKQKLALKSQRLARYKKALDRKEDNKLFFNNEKEFYRSLKGASQQTSSELPHADELRAYWANIWESQGDYNNSAEWIGDEEKRLENIEEMQFCDITPDDIRYITKRFKNWKAAGVDSIHNFWYKKLSVLHGVLANNITDLISGHQSLPKFVTQGKTYMLPKSNDTKNPSQYRPITCLPTIYKLITSCITYRINRHLTQNNILAEEQKGCRQNHQGCKEQLTIDSTVLKHAHTKKRNLHITYIDYKKAFDSVPHAWLLKILQIYKIDPRIISFLRDAMIDWRTTLHLSNNTTTITTSEIPIRNGIFQGDSLSPLWFCLALNPLSHMLNSTASGYKLTTTTSLTHLLYMDDIKLFSKSEKDLTTLIDLTTKFSTDIKMTFGLDKCRTLHIQKGKVTINNNDKCEPNNFIELEPSDTYKYLGILQSNVINHIQIKKQLYNEYIRRLNLICKKQLYSKNMFKAINTFAIPVLTYSFGVIKWTKTDINKLEIKTRTTLTKHNYLHPKSAIERISVKRQNGGRGLIDLKLLWDKQINTLRKFFYEKSNTSDIHSAIVAIDDKYTPLNLTDKDIEFDTRQDHENIKLNRWRSKELHGRHIHDLEQQHVDLEASNKWLKVGYLFPETEGFMVAIQDQVINTKNYRKHIFKDPNAQNDKCRKCHRQPETIQHITSACPTLTQTDYTHRHNQVVHIIHQKLAIKHNLIDNNLKPYYQYVPSPVLESSSHKMYFDRAILTDKTIHNNRPDITLIDKTEKCVYLIDIAIPNTHNIQKTITDKIHKYTELKEEIIRIWKMNKVYIVPLVLSSTGVIPKYLHHSIQLLNLSKTLYITMQKAAILNTCRIVRKFLQDDTSQE